MAVLRGLVAASILTSVLVALLASQATAESSCVSVGWEQLDADCTWTYADYSASASSGDGQTWVVTIQCGNGGICSEHVECEEGGAAGFWHDVFLNGNDVGDVCVPENEVDQVNIAQLILREFRRIAWPDSELVVQPPGGKTLVNFETNFYTPDHAAITQDVVLAGRRVAIRAVPTSYTFHFGDGTSTTTDSPGAPHPDLDVTHAYQRTGKVTLGLDTTYAGEYRIGDGDWVAITETLTVAGDGQPLEIVEALPQLVIR
ncbi:hypothetical protein [Nocardioides sp. SYSU D00065]|uniref:hypothetical protein n=1 Tax=Nocardioides sp. SYSU D00065 TaxID=2817378 RepID=UPI001B328123|nr:hypothetical protein [Nocardioides sp. SYSU D00065]